MKEKKTLLFHCDGCGNGIGSNGKMDHLERCLFKLSEDQAGRQDELSSKYFIFSKELSRLSNPIFKAIEDWEKKQIEKQENKCKECYSEESCDCWELSGF